MATMLRNSDRRTSRVCRHHVHAGPAGNVVEHDRQRRRLGDRLEVLVEAFLRRLVVVRRDRQQPVGADALHVARQLDHFPRVVSAGAGQHGHLALGFLDDQLHHAQLVAMRQRRRLARRPARRQKVDASVDLPASQTLDRGLIERAVTVNGVMSAVPTPVNGVRMVDLRLWALGSGLLGLPVLSSRSQPFKTSCIEYQPVRP